MTESASRALLFGVGFALWTAFSLLPAYGGYAIREGWDRAGYWSVGIPVLLALQVVLAAFSNERPSRQPLWLLAGHFAAMLLVHPAGTSLALLPIAIVFIGVPAYGGLYLAALIGKKLGPLAR